MLRAAGVGAGDEVVVPAFGNVEVAEAVTRAGALPVFADIDPLTYCLEPAAVEAAVTPRTAAVVVVHRFGRIEVGAPIMMVATAAPHRRAAFDGADFLMDWLKSRAPFWKREIGADGPGGWVAAKDADEDALSRW